MEGGRIRHEAGEPIVKCPQRQSVTLVPPFFDHLPGNMHRPRAALFSILWMTVIVLAAGCDTGGTSSGSGIAMDDHLPYPDANCLPKPYRKVRC